MKPLRPVKKWVLTTIGVLLALLMLKIIWFLTARPKVTVDYVAEYNRISRPKDFDPNQNAAQDYQKAFDAFVVMPGPGSFNFDERRYYRMPRGQSIRTIGWPKDFNDADQNALRQWLASNEQAFGHFRAASGRPYYWIEREDKDKKGIIGVPMPELGSLRNLAEAMTWSAKVKAADGQYQAAFEDILTCFRAGRQNCRNPSLLMKQFFILVIKERTLNAALTIIDRVQLEP
jgi:hypothetical protein